MNNFEIENIKFKVENLKLEHINNGYLCLLEQLTIVNIDNIKNLDIENFVNSLNKNHQIKVLIDQDKNKIVGSVTIFKEQKFIHGFGKVAHIEDVVIDNNYRNLGLGKIIIEIAKKAALDCYKIILNCDIKNVKFYEKCDFSKNGICMTVYN